MTADKLTDEEKEWVEKKLAETPAGREVLEEIALRFRDVRLFDVRTAKNAAIAKDD